MPTSGANTQPIYPGTPFTKVALLTDQTANRTSTGNLVDIHTAGAAGALIHSLVVVPRGDNIQTVLRLFYELAGTGINSLILEQTLPASASSAEDAEQPEVVIDLFPLLPTNSSNRGLLMSPSSTLRAALGTGIVTGINVVASGGDY